MPSDAPAETPTLRRVLAQGAAEALSVRGVGILVGLAAHVVLTRSMSVADYGAFVFVTAWLGIVALPCTLGFHQALVRFVASYAAEGARERLRAVVRYAHRATLATSLAAGLAAAGVLLALDPSVLSYPLGALLLGAAILPVTAVATTSSATLRGLKLIAWSRAPIVVLRPVVVAVVIGALVLSDRSVDATHALGAWLIGSLLGLGLLAARERRELVAVAAAVTTAEDRRRWRGVAVPLMLATALQLLLMQMDVVLLGIFEGGGVLGPYGAALRVAAVLLVPAVALQAILGPVIAEAHAAGTLRGRQAALRKVTRAVLALVLVGAVVQFAAAEPILRLFGDQYDVAAPVLRWRAAAYVLYAASGPCWLLLAMTGGERTMTLLLAVTTAATLVVHLVVIPSHGANGAAVVGAASTVVWSLVLLVAGWRRLRVRLSAI